MTLLYLHAIGLGFGVLEPECMTGPGPVPVGPGFRVTEPSVFKSVQKLASREIRVTGNRQVMASTFRYLFSTYSIFHRLGQSTSSWYREVCYAPPSLSESFNLNTAQARQQDFVIRK